MQPRLRSRRAAAFALAAVTAAAATGFVGSGAGAAPGATTDPATDTATTTGVDNGRAVVQLSLDPVSVAARTKPAKGKKIDFSSTAVKSQRALLSAQRNDFKKWLQRNAPKASVTGEFDIAVNAVTVTLNGTSMDVLRSAPGVLSVSPEGVYTKTDDADPDIALVNAFAAWSSVGGPAAAGRGVKVGIVDSGIAQDHTCFDGGGYPAFTGNRGVVAFTNSKVVVAKVFHMNAKQKGYTPEAIDSHGTHVAGTVACELDTPATVNGVTIPYRMSGVAPAAQLGNYNVFPADEANARSEDILNALDAAAQDGMDVINMSLGGGAHGIQDLLTIAVDNLDVANIVVAVSNGNEGPGHETVGSPGSAARALSSGAASVGHFVGLTVRVGGASFGAATGDLPVPGTDLTAPLQAVTTTGATGTVTLSRVCESLPAGSLTGRIALVSRGTCTFVSKARTVEAAGAVGMIVVNNVAGDPTAMGTDDAPDQPTIPSVMVGLADRDALLARSGQDATIGAALAYVRSANDDVMAGFSSQGPTDVDRRVKPDVVAPGVNVLSAVPATASCAAPCFEFLSGTSMSSPHVAGIAAVVRGARPSWTAEQVRSAVVNTAVEGRAKEAADGVTPVTDVNVVGAGSADVARALRATVALGPVSTSFGAVPSGSGQTLSRPVTVTNLGTAGIYALSVTGSGFSVSPASVTLAAGASATVTVTLSLPKGAAKGDWQGRLAVSRGGEVAHSVLYALVK